IARAMSRQYRQDVRAVPWRAGLASGSTQGRQSLTHRDVEGTLRGEACETPGRLCAGSIFTLNRYIYLLLNVLSPSRVIVALCGIL
ncbi:MAG TPA: hypothetical protein PLD03_10590, partial [Thiomonas arsenitoxydans]|nr:hypothetical protein [Thiomonas arsenitoxydans]